MDTQRENEAVLDSVFDGAPGDVFSGQGAPDDAGGAARGGSGKQRELAKVFNNKNWF